MLAAWLLIFFGTVGVVAARLYHFYMSEWTEFQSFANLWPVYVVAGIFVTAGFRLIYIDSGLE